MRTCKPELTMSYMFDSVSLVSFITSVRFDINNLQFDKPDYRTLVSLLRESAVLRR